MSTKIIFNNEAILRTITRICHEILERNKGVTNVVLAGIKTRGYFLALRISKKIEQIENIKLDVVEVDISNYRDDKKIKSNNFKLNYNLENKIVILVDDVMFTGRTVRAAIDCILDFYRPSKIMLAVLVDRGHRELPIRADFVGKNIPTSINEKIKVHLVEVDNEDVVLILNG
ncbi:bifunctional pyr operon transcriptional regulator/uracil phosphoribosyltransferase PyrR [Spiroplasma turonicum]|uniref:Bifunctional protein PyrR n=1 Tax=Spiroplasma turonicum TaxID=216946 RepID=A0A0K1P745_9MOLU|nr:bifunctional pyr operon transcriptional regulator/uracil phosphoribosyltransferase PyrR [Spiroplasma turonicum]AKU80019.1 pyrimidine operon repressor [Spiroplasma turonicum]ALX71021.1 pyrimidine operon attenuation protein / uracil phosphoribosyltransferase [Spiroplasma turonicum]